MKTLNDQSIMPAMKRRWKASGSYEANMSPLSAMSADGIHDLRIITDARERLWAVWLSFRTSARESWRSRNSKILIVAASHAGI